MFNKNLQEVIRLLTECFRLHEVTPWETIGGDTTQIRFMGKGADGQERDFYLHFLGSLLRIRIPKAQLSENMIDKFVRDFEYQLEQRFLQNIRMKMDNDQDFWNLEIQE